MKELWKYKNSTRSSILRDTNRWEEDDSHLGDFIPDDESPAPQDSAAYTLLKEQLEEVMENINT